MMRGEDAREGNGWERLKMWGMKQGSTGELTGQEGSERRKGKDE